MLNMQVDLTPMPDEETAVAVIAAIAYAIAQDTASDVSPTPTRSSWRAAVMLAAQGMPAARNIAFAKWHAAERAGRADHWSYGIIGI
jgi:hypothetical protein